MMKKILMCLMMFALLSACNEGSSSSNPNNPSDDDLIRRLSNRSFNVKGSQAKTIQFDDNGNFKTAQSGTLLQTGNWDVEEGKVLMGINGSFLSFIVIIDGNTISLQMNQDQTLPSSGGTLANAHYPCYPLPEAPIALPSKPGDNAGTPINDATPDVEIKPVNIGGSHARWFDNSNIHMDIDSEVNIANNVNIQIGGMPMIIFVNSVAPSAGASIPADYDPCYGSDIPVEAPVLFPSPSYPSDPDDVSVHPIIPEGTWCFDSGEKIDEGSLASMVVDDGKAYVSYLSAQNQYYPVYDLEKIEDDAYAINYGGISEDSFEDESSEALPVAVDNFTVGDGSITVEYSNGDEAKFLQISDEGAAPCPFIK